MATLDTDPKLGWPVRSEMWVALVLAACVGASAPWGQGIWPEWPTEERRGQQAVVRKPLRLENTEFDREPFVQPQRSKNTYSAQKETEIGPHHLKITYKTPPTPSRHPYHHYKTKTSPKLRLKVELNRRWREYMRRWGDKKNHLVLRLPTISLATKHKPYRATKHKPRHKKPYKTAPRQRANRHKAIRGRHHDL